MSKLQKLELTWIGKEKQPRLELLLKLEGNDAKGLVGKLEEE